MWSRAPYSAHFTARSGGEMMEGRDALANVAKLHHTVPKFYLRGFANDDERIVTMLLPGDNPVAGVNRSGKLTRRSLSRPDMPAPPLAIALCQRCRSER